MLAFSASHMQYTVVLYRIVWNKSNQNLVLPWQLGTLQKAAKTRSSLLKLYSMWNLHKWRSNQSANSINIIIFRNLHYVDYLYFLLQVKIVTMPSNFTYLWPSGLSTSKLIDTIVPSPSDRMNSSFFINFCQPLCPAKNQLLTRYLMSFEQRTCHKTQPLKEVSTSL